MAVKIFIIGAGAIGKTLSVLLANNGRDVMLLRASSDQEARHFQTIRVIREGTEQVAEIETSCLANLDALDGIILLTSKSFGNEDVAARLLPKSGNSPVILLQNGLGVENSFINHGFPEIYRCVLFATCQMAGENTVTYKPVSVSRVGEIKRHRTDLDSIIRAMDTAEFRFQAEPDIQPVIWKKAISNCVFNSICPLIETDNGIFARDPFVFGIAQQVIRECVAVANAAGVSVDVASIEQQVLLISTKSDGQKISTFQDIENGRQTEIDTLNFEVVRIATSLRMETQVSRTKLLGDLVKKKSELVMAKR